MFQSQNLKSCVSFSPSLFSALLLSRWLALPPSYLHYLPPAPTAAGRLDRSASPLGPPASRPELLGDTPQLSEPMRPSVYLSFSWGDTSETNNITLFGFPFGTIEKGYVTANSCDLPQRSEESLGLAANANYCAGSVAWDFGGPRGSSSPSGKLGGKYVPTTLNPNPKP